MKELIQIRSIALLLLLFCSIQHGVAQNKEPAHHIIFHVIKKPACPPYPVTFDLELDIEAVNLQSAQYDNYAPFRLAILAPNAGLWGVYVGLSEEITVSPQGWFDLGGMDCGSGEPNHRYRKGLVIPLDFSKIPCQPGQDYVPSQEFSIIMVYSDFDPNAQFPEYYDDMNCIQTIFPFSCFGHHTSSVLGSFSTCHACNTGIPPNHNPSSNLANSNAPDHLSNEINAEQKLGAGDSSIFSTLHPEDMKDHTTIYPNPFNNELLVEYSSDSRQDIQLVITDINGRTIQISKQLTEQGINKFSFDTADMPNGIYFLSITNGSHTYSKKIIK